MWLDLARDYTEGWTHQQQVRDAVGRPGLTEPEFIDPVLDSFMRALPHIYRTVPAPPGSEVGIELLGGDRRLHYRLCAGEGGWHLAAGPAGLSSAQLALPADALWRLATGGITPDQALSGDPHG